jgi:hypothetical protein
MIKFNNIIFLSIFLLSCSQTDNYTSQSIGIYPVQKLKLSENKIYVIEDSKEIKNQDLLFKKIFNYSEIDFISRLNPDETVTINEQTDIVLNNKNRVINNNSIFFNVIIPKSMEQKFIIGNSIKVITENEIHNGYVNFSTSFYISELEDFRIIEIKLKLDDSKNESTFDKIYSIEI